MIVLLEYDSVRLLRALDALIVTSFRGLRVKNEHELLIEFMFTVKAVRIKDLAWVLVSNSVTWILSPEHDFLLKRL